MFCLVTIGYFGYRYVSSFGSGIQISSFTIGLGLAGLTYGTISQVRVSGLPDTIREPKMVRSFMTPSALVGIVATAILLLVAL